MHYIPRLQRFIDGDPTLPINQSYPDLSPASGGKDRLADATWQLLKQEFKMRVHQDYIKHILAKHDGEVRLVGESDWMPFPASGGHMRQACFWHYQFAGAREIRQYLYDRSEERWYRDDLSDDEVDLGTDDAARI